MDPAVDDGRTPSAWRSVLPGDAAIALALVALSVVGTYFASRQTPGPHRAYDGWAVVLVVAAAGSLIVRRRFPTAVLAVVYGIVFVYLALGYANGPIWLSLIVAFVTAIAAGHRVVPAIVAVTGFLGFPWLDRLLRDGPAPTLLGMAALAAWLLVLWGIAESVRIRRERAAEARRIRLAESQRRAGEERLRIAQELHDALGHQLSLINVQASVALHVNETLPEQVGTSLAAIKAASKAGLTELRSVLAILRQEGERAPRSPTSTLDRVEDLVAQARSAGLPIRLERHGEPRPLPFGVDVAAYRTVQEALTNVSRHAPGATAVVDLDYRDRELVVQVDDDGPGALAEDPDGGGKGILGMRERATALGGELEAGPRSGGGFRVRARLPLEEDR